MTALVGHHTDGGLTMSSLLNCRTVLADTKVSVTQKIVTKEINIACSQVAYMLQIQSGMQLLGCMKTAPTATAAWEWRHQR